MVRASAIALLRGRIGLFSLILLLLDRLGVPLGRYVVRGRGGSRMELRAGGSDRYTVFETLVRGDYLTQRELKSGDTVVDIGANIGVFSILAARQVGPAGRVVAVEPNPETADQLERNVRLNGLSNVHVWRAAVAGRAGTMSLHLGDAALFSSLLPSVDSRRATGRTVQVSCVTLSDILAKEAIERVDLLKMDCEGAEYDIFDAADDELWSRLPAIVMETHRIEGRSPAELKSRLQSQAYHTTDSELLYAWRA